MATDDKQTSQQGEARPESDASRLLDEYFRIRREYNALDRDDPTHAEERYRLRARYRELDRQYGELLLEEGGGPAHSSGSPTGQADALWDQAVREAGEMAEAAPAEDTWVEFQTPVEGDPEFDSLFEQALKEKRTHRPDAETPVSDEGGDILGNPSYVEEDAPARSDDRDAFQDIMRELEAEARRGPAVDVKPEQAAEPDPGPTAMPHRAAPRLSSVRSLENRSRIRPVACPGCGETLPAGTETCPSCSTRIIDPELSLVQQPLPQVELSSSATEPVEQPSIASKVIAIGGWFTVLLGTVMLFGVGTGLSQDYLTTSLEPYGLQSLASEQSGLLLGIALVLIGGTSVGLGLLMAKFVRVVVPLHELARSGRTDGIVKSLARGAEIDETDTRGCTPLHFAVVAGKQEAAELLLEEGADVNARNDRGDTPLHMATANRDEPMCKMLVKRGADALAKNTTGSTLLHVAAWVGDVRLTKRYINGGCPVDARNENGLTPLHFAAQSGYLQTVRALVDAGADVNAASAIGTTPIFPAARNGHLAVVQSLIEAGADPYVTRDHEQATLLEVARINKRDDVVAFLEALGSV